jgi:hypothetical protein
VVAEIKSSRLAQDNRTAQEKIEDIKKQVQFFLVDSFTQKMLHLLNEGAHSDDAYSGLVSRGKFYKIFFLSDIRLSSSFNTGGGSRRVDH